MEGDVERCGYVVVERLERHMEGHCHGGVAGPFFGLAAIGSWSREENEKSQIFCMPPGPQRCFLLLSVVFFFIVLLLLLFSFSSRCPPPQLKGPKLAAGRPAQCGVAMPGEAGKLHRIAFCFLFLCSLPSHLFFCCSCYLFCFPSFSVS